MIRSCCTTNFVIWGWVYRPFVQQARRHLDFCLQILNIRSMERMENSRKTQKSIFKKILFYLLYLLSFLLPLLTSLSSFWWKRFSKCVLTNHTKPFPFKTSCPSGSHLLQKLKLLNWFNQQPSQHLASRTSLPSYLLYICIIMLLVPPLAAPAQSKFTLQKVRSIS